MTSSPVTVLFNPVAARGRAARRIHAVRAEFERYGLAHTLRASAARGDIERAVHDAVRAGERRIVVAGGDGSIHEAVNGLLRAGGGAALGIVPLGTGNDTAKACDLPLNGADAAAQLAERIANGIPARAIDVGCLNGRYFVNGAGIGFDARVSAIAERIRLPIGDLVYLAAVLRGLADGVSTPPLRLSFDGEERYGPLTFANFSNGAWVGGMFPIAPMARNDDGVLDLVTAAPLSRLGVLRLLPRLLRGRHMAHAAMRHAAVTACRVVADAPLVSHLDGEVQAATDVFEVRLAAGGLQLL
ncbi:MAG TPA: YegS/Rv2252/BmrU family lipid kinase [Woeseiaceae bacterium]|nr:YegS/Rv2252/BmrU family lipid kinase [Woeseiaceae bacterium]